MADIKVEEKDCPEKESDKPLMTSPEWHDYVMSQFTEDELLDDCPNVDALRRVVELLIGPVNVVNELLSYDTVNKVAVAKSTVTKVVDNRSFQSNSYGLSIYNGTPTSINSDIADASLANTDAPYNKHLSATAATRAEARVYRKMLRLRKVVSTEEKSLVAEGAQTAFEQDSINAMQVMLLNTLGARHNINIEAYINSGSKKYASVYDIPYTTAQSMLSRLNDLIKEGVDVSLKGYNSNWSKK